MYMGNTHAQIIIILTTRTFLTWFLKKYSIIYYIIYSNEWNPHTTTTLYFIFFPIYAPLRISSCFVCECGGEISFGWFSFGPGMGVDSKTKQTRVFVDGIMNHPGTMMRLSLSSSFVPVSLFSHSKYNLKNYYSMSFYFGLFLTIPSPSSSFHPPPSQWSMVWMTRVVPCWRMTTTSFYWTEVPPCGMRPQEWFPPW